MGCGNFDSLKQARFDRCSFVTFRISHGCQNNKRFSEVLQPIIIASQFRDACSVFHHLVIHRLQGPLLICRPLFETVSDHSRLLFHIARPEAFGSHGSRLHLDMEAA